METEGIVLDGDQLEAVTCETNAVVSAGAGSGKTSVLTERYLHLITAGKAEVDNILALTFTRKAASEMYERIYTRLLSERGKHPSAAKQIEKFNKAHISTLDSFCSRIARDGANMAGVSPDFTIDDNESKKLAEQTALTFLLQNGDEERVRELILEYGFTRVWKELFSSIGYTAASLTSSVETGIMETSQKVYLEKTIITGTKKVAALLQKIDELDGNAGKSIKNAKTVVTGIDDLRAAAKGKKYSELLEGLEALKGIHKASGSSKKEALIFLNDFVDDLRQYLDPLLQALYSLLHWDRVRELFSLVERYMEAFLREKRQSGVLSFRDVQELAIEVLKKSPAVRRYYKSQFRYIMIDEFQDNNDIQKRLLYLLAERVELFEEVPGPAHLEKGKLFFVGDEKQSIYRFRGADVRVFKKLRGEMKETGGKQILLPFNYRSRSELIDFFNILFQNIFNAAESAENGREYEAEFSPLRGGARDAGSLTAGAHCGDVFTPGGRQRQAPVHLFFKPYEEAPDPARYGTTDEAEAFAIARFIKTAVKEKSISVGKDGKEGPAEYDDFAILMRSTGNQVIYERAFRHFNIPYATESVRTLFLEAPFNDIYYALQLSLFHKDRIAYAAFLRSPFVNLSDDTVFRILLSNSPPFSEAEEELGPDRNELERYRAGREIYLFLTDKVMVLSITELVRYLWFDTGYRFHVLKNPAHHTYLEYFDYLYQLCLDADRRGVSLTEFLDFLRENLGKYERLDDFETLKESKQGVHILTVHKSKGLEYPVVVLANTGNLGRSSSEGLYYLSEEFGLTFGIGGGEKKQKNFFFEQAKQEEKLKENAELKRLLYVACTRARDHLVISGCHHKGNQRSENAVINMVLQALSLEPFEAAGVIDVGGVTVHLDRIPEIERGKLSQKIVGREQRELRRTEEIYKRAEEITFPVRRFNFAATEFTPAGLSGGDGHQAEGEALPPLTSDKLLKTEAEISAFGTLTHYIMERKIKKTWERAALPGAYLSRFALKNREQIINDASELCDRFFTTEAGKILFTEASAVYPELDFILRVEDEGTERFITGRIDLFFETAEQGVIVDFKTDRKADTRSYTNQMKIYRAAAEEFTDLPITCFLCFLRGPLTVEIDTAGPLELEFPDG
jgi:ATP-dependent exoDNAse (exonuclease V) beta subunit